MAGYIPWPCTKTRDDDNPIISSLYIKNHLVLHLSENILDHGVPENVNSAYAESAHIPLSKVTARNTQKRAATFTKQAAERYVENLAISSAKYDMQQDDLAGCIASDNSNTAGQGKPWG